MEKDVEIKTSICNIVKKGIISILSRIALENYLNYAKKELAKYKYKSY